MYARLPYALTQGDVELPYLMLQATIFSVIVYSMIGFQWTAGEPADLGSKSVCRLGTHTALSPSCHHEAGICQVAQVVAL